MKIRICFIIFFCINAYFSNGQYCISDLLNIKEINTKGIDEIQLFKIKDFKKILVESIELNSKGYITKKTKYCDFSYGLLDNIEITIYDFDKTDTLLIGRRYENERGDTLSFIKYSYKLNTFGKVEQKGIEDLTDNKYEEEIYSYNSKGLLIENKSLSYNYLRDSIQYIFVRKYEYDKSSHLIREILIDSNLTEFERIYTYNSLGKLINHQTSGIHQCGYDIDRYKINYNSDLQPVLKEYWNASGENWAFEYQYNKSGFLNRKITKMRYPKEIEKDIASTKDVLPPPPFYTQNMLDDEYTDESVIDYIYDNGRLIKVKETSFKFDIKDEYVFEYK